MECGCLSSRPLGCLGTFFSFIFFFCVPGSHFFSEVDLRLKLDFSKASILPSWGLSSLSVKR